MLTKEELQIIRERWSRAQPGEMEPVFDREVWFMDHLRDVVVHSRQDINALLRHIDDLSFERKKTQAREIQYAAVREILKDHGCTSSDDVVHVPLLVETWIGSKEKELTAAQTDLDLLRKLLPLAMQAGIAYAGVTNAPPPSEFMCQWLDEHDPNGHWLAEYDPEY